MKLHRNCLECVVQQACNTLALHQIAADIHQQILDEIKQQLVDVDWEQTPADLSNVAYRTIEKYLKIDPYADAKKSQNQMALGFYPQMKQLVEQSENRLLTAVRIAATGNVIDLGIGMKVDIAREVERILHAPFPIDDTPHLQQRLTSRRRILYIGDNAGEIVFDRILVEELLTDHDVTFVVRGGAVINDATVKDAEQTGMSRVVPVITTGSNRIGVPWAYMSDQYQRHYRQADLVISKGQGNYETISERYDKETYFILRAKCGIIADDLGVSHLDLIMKHTPARC
jgi:damage-control phosphatase, subfamily I